MSPVEIILDDTACKPTNASSLGLQMGYFLEKAERDYVIIEKESVAGIKCFREVLTI